MSQLKEKIGAKIRHQFLNCLNHMKNINNTHFFDYYLLFLLYIGPGGFKIIFILTQDCSIQQ